MSILVFAESSEQGYKKTALETVSYAKNIAKNQGEELTVVTFNSSDNTFLNSNNNKHIPNLIFNL